MLNIAGLPAGRAYRQLRTSNTLWVRFELHSVSIATNCGTIQILLHDYLLITSETLALSRCPEKGLHQMTAPSVLGSICLNK